MKIAVLLFDRIILKNTNHKISAFVTLLALTCFTVWFKDVEDIFKDIEWAILFLILCGTTLFLFVLLIIEIIKFLLGMTVSKYFQVRYNEIEIKEFCHKFSTGTFYRSKWKYEGTGIDARYLEQLIQKLIDDEIIIPIDTTKRRDETDYKIKSSDKEKILRRIHSKIIKFEKMGKTIKKVLRIVAYSAILIIGSIILFGVYEGLIKPRFIERKHLNYMTEAKWTWWNKYERIQKRYIESAKRTILRKVDLANQSVIMMYLGDDYRLVVYVKFFTSCTPGTFIRITKKYSDGTPQKLTCQEHQVNDVSHTYLINRFSIESYSGSTIIQGDLDGFKFDSGSLYDWKLDELKKEITLLRAQPKK